MLKEADLLMNICILDRRGFADTVGVSIIPLAPFFSKVFNDDTRADVKL